MDENLKKLYWHQSQVVRKKISFALREVMFHTWQILLCIDAIFPTKMKLKMGVRFYYDQTAR